MLVTLKYAARYVIAPLGMEDPSVPFKIVNDPVSTMTAFLVYTKPSRSDAL